MLEIIAHPGVSCERAMFVLHQELGLQLGEGTQAHRVVSGVALEEMMHTRAMSHVADLPQDQMAESVLPHLRPFIEPVDAAAVIAMYNDNDGHSARLKALRTARQAA